MDRIIQALDPVINPLIVLAITAIGGWGLWVSTTSLESARHLDDYAATVSELKVVAMSLAEVERDFATLHANVQADAGVNRAMLQQILQQLQLQSRSTN